MKTSYNPNGSYRVSGRLLNEIGRGVNLSQRQLNNTISHGVFSQYGCGEVRGLYHSFNAEEETLPAFSPVAVMHFGLITEDDESPLFYIYNIKCFQSKYNNLNNLNASLFISENKRDCMWGITLSPVKTEEITTVRINGICKCRVKVADVTDLTFNDDQFIAVPDFINGSLSYFNLYKKQNYKLYRYYGVNVIAVNPVESAFQLSKKEIDGGFRWALIELNKENNKIVYGMFDVVRTNDTLLCFNSLDEESDVAGLVNINSTYFKVLKQSFSLQEAYEKEITTAYIHKCYLVIHFVPPKYDYNAESEDTAYIAGECNLELLTSKELNDISKKSANILSSMDAYYIVAIVYLRKESNSNVLRSTIEFNRPSGIITFPWFSGYTDMLADSVKPGYYSIADDKNILYK